MSAYARRLVECCLDAPSGGSRRDSRDLGAIERGNDTPLGTGCESDALVQGKHEQHDRRRQLLFLMEEEERPGFGRVEADGGELGRHKPDVAQAQLAQPGNNGSGE